MFGIIVGKFFGIGPWRDAFDIDVWRVAQHPVFDELLKTTEHGEHHNEHHHSNSDAGKRDQGDHRDVGSQRVEIPQGKEQAEIFSYDGL